MKADLYELKEQLLLFKNELMEWICWDKDHKDAFSENSDFKPGQEREAYGWIFLEPHYWSFWGISDESMKEGWPENYPKDLLAAAQSYFSTWLDKELEMKGGIKYTKGRLKSSNDYRVYGIVSPEPQETLIKYVKRLRYEEFEHKHTKKLWWESLGSFLEYVKAYTQPECHGYIDVIFPHWKIPFEGKVIRGVLKEKYPTNILVVMGILKNLAETMLWGDVRSQHCAAEALAFAWICLTSARSRLPTRINLLEEFDASTLSAEERPERLRYTTRYTMKVPTLFGAVQMEISKSLYQYLQTLEKINKSIGVKDSFLKHTERGLRGIFSKAVKKLNLSSSHGPVTFTTLTSWPTTCIHHRTQIDNSRYKAKAKPSTKDRSSPSQ